MGDAKHRKPPTTWHTLHFGDWFAEIEPSRNQGSNGHTMLHGLTGIRGTIVNLIRHCSCGSVALIVVRGFDRNRSTSSLYVSNGLPITRKSRLSQAIESQLIT